MKKLISVSLFLILGIVFGLAQKNTNILKINAVQKISNRYGKLGNVNGADVHFGKTLTCIGDLDGDGIPDMAVSADQTNDGGYEDGAFFILFMNHDGTVKKEQKISQTSGGLDTTFPSNTYKFGYSIASLGDVDGDGVEDLAVGAVGAGGYDGAVWILFMKTDGTVKSKTLISNLGGPAGDLFGCDVAGIGDLNGDGVPDLAIGAYGYNGNQGIVYIAFLNKDGSVKSYRTINSSTPKFDSTMGYGVLFGCSVRNIGDHNGDGINDLAVGAPFDNNGNTNSGSVYIINLTDSGTVKSYSKIGNNSTNLSNAIPGYEYFGECVDGLADMNGDGIKDLLVGAHTDSDTGSDRGAVFIIYLDSNENVKSYQKISAKTSPFDTLLHDGDEFGYGCANIGNLASSSSQSISVGAPYDNDSASASGAVYVITFNSITSKLPSTTLLGHVSQSTGKPLKNTKVYLLSYNPGDSLVTAVDSIVSDSTGYYKFSLSTIDSVVYLYANPDSTSYPNQMPTYDSIATAFQYSKAIRPKTGTNTANFSMVGGTNPGGSGFIGGKVTLCNCKRAGAGQPVAALKIILMNNGVPVAYAYTDKYGSFGFKNLANGNYSVYVDRPLVDNNVAPTVKVSTSEEIQKGLNFSLTPTQLELLTTSAIESVVTDKNSVSVYPNPFTGFTHLNYHLAGDVNVDIRIYDMSGKEVSVIASGMQYSGDYTYSIDKNSNITTGVYFIRYIIGNEVSAIRIVNVE